MLRRAVCSVLSQTYPHFQVCVYDNASGDETASVVAELAKLDSRVKYHCHSENIGALKNFIYGMEHVETPFFSFLPDDDVLLPEFYETAMEGFNNFPDAIFSAGSIIQMTDKGKIIAVYLSSWKRDGYYTPPDGLFEMLEKYGPGFTAAVFRKDIIKKVGVFDLSVGAPADLDYLIRTMAHFPFVISRKPCAIWTTHSSSFTVQLGFSSDVWLGWLKLIRNLSEDKTISLNVRIHATSKLTGRIKKMLFWSGIIYIKNNDFEKAYKTIKIFRDYYKSKNETFILCTLANFRKHFPPGYFFLVSANKYYNKIKYKKDYRLQEQFGQYARFLEF